MTVSKDAEMASLAETMRRAATDLIDALHEEQRSAACRPLRESELRDWTYLPGPRPGLRLGELADDQLDLALTLLATAYGSRGYSDVTMVIRAEAARRALALAGKGTTGIDPYRDLPYWLRIFGEPAAREPWGWQINGHHLLAHATVVDDEVAGVPQFCGVEPATLLSGPHTGLRGLPREEDLARELVLALQPDQREAALLADVAPNDISTRFDPVARTPAGIVGITHRRLDRSQRALFEALLRQYLDRAAEPVANQAWADIVDAGLDQVTFGWAGPLEHGSGHYYAISGPSLLIEYDNTQDNANHIHSVWRDLTHDFGGDLLARHYARAHDPDAIG